MRVRTTKDQGGISAMIFEANEGVRDEGLMDAFASKPSLEVDYRRLHRQGGGDGSGTLPPIITFAIEGRA